MYTHNNEPIPTPENHSHKVTLQSRTNAATLPNSAAIKECMAIINRFWAPINAIKGGSMVIVQNPAEKPYTCPLCAKPFKYKYAIPRHIHTKHTRKSLHQCDTCGKKFTCTSGLHTHIKIHTGGNSNQCDTCGAKFMNRNQLSVHKTIHTGKKTYRCDICGIHFAYSSNLYVHIKKHIGEKPFKCNQCNKQFTTKSGLKIHKTSKKGCPRSA